MTGASSRFEYCRPSLTTTCIFWLIQPLSRYNDYDMIMTFHVSLSLNVFKGTFFVGSIIIVFFSHHNAIIMILGIIILAGIKVMVVFPFSSSP